MPIQKSTNSIQDKASLTRAKLDELQDTKKNSTEVAEKMKLVSLLMTPSDYDHIKKSAKKLGITASSLMRLSVNQYLKDHGF